MNNPDQPKLFNDEPACSEKNYTNLGLWANAVKQRDNFTCQYSVGDIYRKHDGPIEAHHILPKSYGGKNVISNGITLCKNCHAQFLVEAEQKFYGKNLQNFFIKIKDLVSSLFGVPNQQRYYVLLDYLTGGKTFRDEQLNAIKIVVEKNKNLIFVSPTGSGKSVIYQIAGILSQEQTLVISPLMALQKNQVESLWKRWVPATLINSSLNKEEKQKRLTNVLNSSYSFVFAHPKQFLHLDHHTEQIELRSNNLLMQANFGTLCVDEAHVIHNWGKQFIEEYAQLLKLRRHFGIKSTILLSASLTKKMQNELIDSLFDESDKPELIVTGFYRPEIKLFVEKFNPFNEENESRLSYISRLLYEANDKKAMIFATSKKQVEEVTDYLKSKGHNVEGYYSKLESEVKIKIQNRFSGEFGNDLDVLVCTSAFGMGINISNIHLAIHYSLPFSLNDYYQQFGRIGRDGRPSKAYLLYDIRESTSLINFIQSKELDKVTNQLKRNEIIESFEEDKNILLAYISSDDKWNYILDYFGDTKPDISSEWFTKFIKDAFKVFILFFTLYVLAQLFFS